MKNVSTDFSQPHEITDSTNVHSLLPKMSDIPEDFDNHYNKWNRVVSKWFFEGIRRDAFKAKSGIDRDKALRHIAAVISSWSLKHEHKTAGAAFLLSLWFDDATI